MQLPSQKPARRNGLAGTILTHWELKFAGTTLFMSLFFMAYFWLLKNPMFPVTVMPSSALDEWLGFRPEALAAYVSLWFYVTIPPSLLDDRRDLYQYGLAAGVVAVVGLVIFLFWPTTTPPAAIDWTKHSGYSFLKTIDAAGNACPSLHVTFAVFSCLALGRWLRRAQVGVWVRAVNVCWCGAIIVSTLVTKQHVFLDVLAGGALGLAGGLVYLSFTNRSPANVLLRAVRTG